MTLSSAPFDRRSIASERDHTQPRWLHSSVSALSFWSAIFIPVVYPVLLAGGIETFAQFAFLCGVIGFHILVLIGGHHHHTDST